MPIVKEIEYEIDKENKKERTLTKVVNDMISKADKRDNTIDEVLRHYGLSVIIRNEMEFNHIKKFLGEDVLYLDFVPQMYSTETAIVIWSDNIDFAPGSVGKADYHKSKFFRLVEFSDFFKI